MHCDNIIPAEIAQKIVEKIYSAERFVVYVVTAMFPDGGHPSSIPTQEMLYLQTRTMEMMYTRIAEALKVTGSTSHPTGNNLYGMSDIRKNKIRIWFYILL